VGYALPPAFLAAVFTQQMPYSANDPAYDSAALENYRGRDKHMTEQNREERPFARDAASNGGYVYTTNRPWSARVAIERQTQAVLDLAEFSRKRVIDIGCGDGATTIDLYDRTLPESIEAIDPAAAAIAVAQSRREDRPVHFSVGSAYCLPWPDLHFDVAHLRGVLHHMNDPQQAVREAARVARQVVILEPNGWNPALKLIEKLSPYHRAHGERSFLPETLRRWLREAGLRVGAAGYCCLVPYFCPEGPARLLKRVEPLAEGIPGIRHLVCGAYALRGDHIPRVVASVPISSTSST